MPAAHKKLILWLHICCFMIFAMAVIGAVTRLTESGLSITEWKPITGALPPLNEQAWQKAFALYQASPEFEKKHFWMDLAAFKKIYFWEWLHRLWGRLIGVVFALPLLYFWARRQIPPGYGVKFLGALALGGAQGFMGWYMVQSGLVDRPSVSHFRLAAHLGLALLIFSYLWWLALSLADRPKIAVRRGLLYHGWGMLALLALTILWGAFTAGLDAGMVYNTFPMMNEHWVPPELMAFNGPLHNILHTPAAVQFAHRVLALLTFTGIAAFALRRRDFALLGMVFLQLGLGIVTILSQVHLHAAALHQAGAIALLALMLRALHRVRIEEKPV